MLIKPTTLLLFFTLALPAQAQPPRALEGDLGEAQRIWAAVTREQHEVWMRRSFILPAEVSDLRLVASCDNGFRVFLDGKELGALERWEEVLDLRLGKLGKGKHVIAVHAKNRGSCAALALWLSFKDGKGQPQEIVSDRSWRVAEQESAGWKLPGFDDRRWIAAREQGLTPFGKTVYNTVPERVHYLHDRSLGVARLEAALGALRRAPDTSAALRALEELERALMESRRRLGRMQRRAQAKK